MKNVNEKLDATAAAMKKLLPAQDILQFSFSDGTGRQYVCFFADAITDKDLLGEQVFRPLMEYRGEARAKEIAAHVTAPEVRTERALGKLAAEVLAGNPVLLWDGMDEGLIAGTKKVPARAVSEPPTDVAIKGPREGFVEDVKLNTALVRKRLKTGELKIVSEKAFSDGDRAKVKCYGADDVNEGVAIMRHEGVDVSITGNSTNPTRFQHPVAGTYKKWATENGKKYFSVASGGGTGRTLHPDNMAAGPASYGMTDTMGRMHSDAQFAGSSSVPAHVEMMGLIGMGNNPMVGATVAVAVAVSEAK